VQTFLGDYFVRLQPIFVGPQHGILLISTLWRLEFSDDYFVIICELPATRSFSKQKSREGRKWEESNCMYYVCIYTTHIYIYIYYALQYFPTAPLLPYTTVHTATWRKSFSDHSTPSICTQNYNSATWGDLLPSFARSNSLVVLLGMSACSL
jgi:hypothetical protein